MNISVSFVSPVFHKYGYINKYSNLAPLKQDTVSFGSMKKNQFSSIDLMVVNKFNAPIEKFNSNEDFQNWCNYKIHNDLFNKIIKGRNDTTEKERNTLIKNWTEYLSREKNTYNSALALFILDGITSSLKKNNDSLPPILNTSVLADTIIEIKRESENNKNYQADFNKMYQHNLQNKYLSELTDNPENYTGWVVISGKINDSTNFYKNVEILQSLSHSGWCTKSTLAKPYLSQGDFHIYMDKGRPRLGVRFYHNVIQEIQGIENNNNIPVKYFYAAKEHAQNYKMNNTLFFEFKNTEKIIKNFEIKVGCPIEEADTEELLKAAGISCKRDNKDGMLVINGYHQPNRNLSWDDLGINENDFFKEIKEIDGEADFRYSKVTNLGNLEKIKGDAYFEECALKNFTGLKEISGNLNLRWSKIKNIGDCKVYGEILKNP